MAALNVGDTLTFAGTYEPRPWYRRLSRWVRGEPYPRRLRRFTVVQDTAAGDDKTILQIRPLPEPDSSMTASWTPLPEEMRNEVQA